LESIDWSNDCLVAAKSNLTGKIWNGEVVIYNNFEKELKQKKSFYTLSCNTSVSWIGDKTEAIVSAGDDGSINIWSLISNKKDKQPSRTLLEHDDIVSSISVNPNDKESLLSSSWDLSLKLWAPRRNSNSSATFYGHLETIWDVKWNQKSDDIFASSSQDSSVKLWDQRKIEATNNIKVGQPAYSLSWNPFIDTLLAVGLQDGTVKILDIRNTIESLHEKKIHKSSIKVLAFSPHDQNLLSCGSDDTKISIISLKDNSINIERILENHTDFVRALSWSKANQGFLASGSWDKSIQLNVV